MEAKVAIDFEVELRRVLAALERYPDEVRDRVRDELRAHMQEVGAVAAMRIHSRSGLTARSYRVRTKRGAVRLVNDTVGATMLEFAAHGKCPQGVSLVRTLNARYGDRRGRGRIAWAEFERRKPAIEAGVRRILAEADAELEGVTA